MLRYLLIFLTATSLTACAELRVSEVVPTAIEVGTPETIYGTTTRAREPDGSYGFQRGDSLRFLEMTVSVPPDHTPGTLDYSYSDPNPETQFVMAGVEELKGPGDLKSRLRGVDEVAIFIHGYNTTQAETAFRAAQLRYDLKIPGATMVYSWPSQATRYGYAYDIDSMLFARDGLEQTVRHLKSMGVPRVVLVAHSMGSALTMEMMRQAELREPGWSKRNIEGVVLIAPDLDVDLFRSQMDAIKTPPDPFIVMVSKKDKLLNISARLRGTAEGERLGNISSAEALSDYRISIIDTTAFNDDAESSHFVAATSPALLAIINSARRVSRTFGGNGRGFDVIAPPVDRNPSGATEIVLTETGQAQVTSP